MSADAFSTLMSSTDSPLIVVTTAAEGEQAGCLVGFHTQSSISGEQYCFWLSKANHTYRVSLRSAHFGLHFLTRDDVAVAEHFGTISGGDTDKFSGIDVDTVPDIGTASAPDAGTASAPEAAPASHPAAVPLLTAIPHRMVVQRLAMLDDGGDHVCVTARVVSATTSGHFTPLRLSDVGHLEAGRKSDERAIHP